MNYRIIKIFTTLLISVIGIAVVYKSMQACSDDGFDCDMLSYSFFDPAIINQPDETPFFVTCHSLYGDYENENIEAINIKEWTAYLKDALSYQEITTLFNLSIENSDSVFNYLTKKTIPLPQNETEKALALRMAKLPRPVIDYFALSKKMDLLITSHSSYYWEYNNIKLDTATYDSLIIIGKQSVKNSSDNFLKARYVFQVQRMLFYLHRYKACIAWYDENAKALNNQGSITLRAANFYAGCFYHKKDYARSNYLFSRIYDESPALKVSAFLSFHPWEDADWNKTLAMATHSHQKEILWQLFGIYADPLKGMQQIYALNPKSPLIDLLLVRAITIYEREQLVNTSYQSDYSYYNTSEPETVANDTTFKRTNFDSSNSFKVFDNENARISLSDFIIKTAAANKTNNQSLWLNAAAYISWINKNYAATENYLVQLKSINNIDVENRAQMTITNALLSFSKIGKLTPQSEQTAYTLITSVEKMPNEKSALVLDYFAQTLAAKFTEQGNILMAELCANKSTDYYKTESNFDNMLNFLRKKNKTDLENYYAAHYHITAANIVEYMAVQELEKNNLDSAIQWFKQDSLAGSATLYGNPFTIHITDCHDCDHSAHQKTKYTKYTFLLKLKELLANAENSKDANEKAQNYFLYANGLYNMSYYGNARMVKECYNFTNIDYYSYEVTPKNATKNCELALSYYQKALGYTTNKEFAAKCTWMSAKCELNNWYESDAYASDKKVYIEGEFFHLMKEKYSTTNYYAEVINECGYFCSFNGGGDECIRNK